MVWKPGYEFAHLKIRDFLEKLFRSNEVINYTVPIPLEAGKITEDITCYPTVWCLT